MKVPIPYRLYFLVVLAFCLGEHAACLADDAAASPLPRIILSENGKDFRLKDTERAFYVWGVNYDHAQGGQLLEDYWDEHWDAVVEDFGEIKKLGANVVRIHLQLGKFMQSETEPNEKSLRKLADLVALAEEKKLYLNLTGLGCYHKQDVPPWYNALPEHERWQVQARFWKAVAQTCQGSPAIFCYDLMNEPVLTGGKGEGEWLAGEPLGGKYFVQRITLDLAGRTREEVAAAWVKTLTDAIREVDDQHLITVGVIPWAHVWPNAKPLFYSPEPAKSLDFVSVHFYPESGKIYKAIAALKVYDIGKPLVIEEFFPMKCSLQEAEQFLAEARPITDGLTSFYWGRTAKEYEAEGELQGAIIGAWLRKFKELAPD